MALTDLVFEFAPLGNPSDLVFGDTADAPPRSVTVSLAFPLIVRAKVGPRIAVNVSLAFPLTVSVDVNYSTDADRPLVGRVLARHQTAAAAPSRLETPMQSGTQTPAGAGLRHQEAAQIVVGPLSGFERAARRHGDSTSPHHQSAIRVAALPRGSSYQDGLRDRRTLSTARHQSADALGARWHTDWQERHRDRRPKVDGRWQEGTAVFKQHVDRAQDGDRCIINLASRYQETIVPPPGETLPVIPPGPQPCYLPDSDLVFFQPAGVYRDLIFICDGGIIDEPTVVVPVRSVYVVINNITLRRVADDTMLPTFGVSLSIDADSWTWGFSTSLPASALDAVMPDSSGPVELEVNINDNLYRVLAENVSSERTFGEKRIRVAGRGKSALLASPYSPIRTFSNSITRTAQQLMNDVLTLNEVPIGWDIDWQISDWLVPAGAWNRTGSYIDGLNAIAAAAGAYLQPHATDQEMSVLHRYPTVPWEWNTVVPDFELPAAVTAREAIEWIEKPAYNRVYVSGVSQGVLGRVTRTGSAGDVIAQLVTDPLITASDAARQRGIAVLGDTGRQAMVTLRLPVLPETGVITPGKFVRYTEGLDERVGIVRSVNVDAGFPEVFQTLRLETHVL